MNMSRALFRSALTSGVLGFVFLTTALPGPAAMVDFRRQIEPIFVKRCSECHGPDVQKAKLRLDRRAEAFKGGKSGKPGVVPGDSQASEVLARVTASDPDERMPSKGEPLTEEQINDLREWINQGASWPDDSPSAHWAFVPPHRPEPPGLGQNDKGSPSDRSHWARNEIDRFILARLHKEGLTAQVEANRYTLIRRLSLDLTGLPPTWAEIEAFVQDSSPDAYVKLVDRLLSSPHYGEHMARWWLDLARYADSNGYQVDLTRSIWPYREWVIKAFNQNMPFDQFTVEQLAGDLLPNATREQKIATGFNRNTKINDEGGGDAEEYRTKAVKDRVATVATTWLGLTMMCSECHTHKYDPITHEDYYRFYALFNSTMDSGNYSVAPTLDVPAPDRSKLQAYLRTRIDQVRRQLAEAEKRLPAEQAAWERRLRGHTTNVWRILTITNAVSTGGAGYKNLPDGSILATGVNPIYDTIILEASTSLSGIKAILLEVLPDDSLPKKGPGRWDKTGNFILDEFTAWAIPAGSRDLAVASSGTTRAGAVLKPAETNLVFARATADWEQQYYRAEHAIDGNPKTGWAIGPRFGQRHFLLAALKNPTPAATSTQLGFRFEHYHGSSHAIGRMRLSVTTEPDPEKWWPVPPEIGPLLITPARQRTPEQQKRLAAHYRTVAPGLRDLERELARLTERAESLTKATYSTLVMAERDKPRESFIHGRGNFLDHGKTVTPGIPAVFASEAFTNVSDRLALARWLVDEKNPLTARVTVNRLWERFFGTGLVKTSEDFGRQGERPSHPELLDWLACELLKTTVPGVDESARGHAGRASPGPAQAWDLQHIQRLIVMSATYRQDAGATPPSLQQDPYNRWLSHGPRFRMDGEMIRDQALTVSGLLNPEVGGPSVHPLQVANLWKELGFLRPEIGMDEWPVSEGPDLYRRGLYTFWRRVCTYPIFATFDAPSRDVCLSRRPRTNTPLQALAALNETTLLEAARVFAQRIMAEGGTSPADRIAFAVRTCLGRPAAPAERARLESFFEQQWKSFRRDAAAARALVQVGSAPRPPELDIPQLAAWVMVANVLFNLDETITKG